MRARTVSIIAGGVITALVIPVSIAHGDQAPPTSTVDVTTTTVEETSPPTTSEFGTETEIVIALDDQNTIVPG